MFVRACLLALAVAAPAASQTSGLALDSLRQNTSLPVEVSADGLSVDQASQTATFSGNVVIAQGEMRLSAPEVVVTYAQGNGTPGRITSVEARGGVTLRLGEDAAEAREAVYSVQDGRVEMRGDVLLTQGQSALSGDVLTIDLAGGTGRIEGGVRTIFRTEGR